jgi:hypothetical protein
MNSTKSSINPTVHPTVSHILRDAMFSRILTDAEISRLSGHLAEQAVRNHEAISGKLHYEPREAFLETAFIAATEVSLALPRYEEGRFIVTSQFEEQMSQAASRAIQEKLEGGAK